MMFEYRRLLSEAWYSHQLYWTLNLIIECVAVGLLAEDILQSPYVLTVAVINIVANLALVILMCKTEKRTLQNRRPEFDLLNTPTGSKRHLLDNSSVATGPFIKVKMKRKIVDQTDFTLRI